MGQAGRRGWISVVTAMLAGCFATSEPSSGDVPGPGGDPGIGSESSALLFRAEDCSDLLGRIQDDVIAKVQTQAALLKLGEEFAPYAGGGDRTIAPVSGIPIGAEGDFANTGPTPAPPSATDPSAPVGTGTGTGTGGSGGGVATGTAGAGGGEVLQTGPTDHSETNTQVAGVDEADIVKTDGQRVYVIHANDLLILDSWPASESAIETQIELEGQALEMFVHENRLVVFATVWDQGDLVEQPKPLPGTEPTATSIIAPDYYYGAPFTKITVVDATPGALPSIERELFLEGSYLSARRHGDTVRAVIQGGFHVPPAELLYAQIEYRDAFGRLYPQEEIDRQVDAWRDRTIASIEMSELSDWLPSERERIGGVLTDPARRCTDFYAPPPGLTDYGLTNVVSFDLADPASALGGAIVLGASDEVYANASVLLLAHRDWRYDARLLDHERTVLHRFELSPSATTYSASGVVPGHILDQFSLDEQAGTVRVTTTQRIWPDFVEPLPVVMLASDEDLGSNRTMTDNRVLTYQEVDGRLVRVGASAPLGEDGEEIMSSRFVGDMAYVVTFRQIDPLTAVDVSDPTAPTVLGELHIPGFSEYMHPLGAGHLLTIGRNTDVNGSDIGLLLQIFDVTDPTHPAQAHSFRYGPDGYSEANQNHKAFTFHRPAGYAEDAGLLAFPFVSYGYPFKSTLEVFDVSAATGFAQLGSVDHTAVLTQTCSYAQPIGDVWVEDIYYQCNDPEVRRGLFIFDETSEQSYVYSVSYGGMLVHDLADMGTAVAEVSFPAPNYNERRGVYATASDPMTAPAPLPASL